MQIPLTDLKAQYESIKGEIETAITGVLREANFILGKQVGLLEQEIAQYLGVEHAVGVASGTGALVLSLAALGIGKGDEVITTPFTFIATAEAISRAGARPVFCDIDEKTLNIDPEKIEKKITKSTKAILPVHLYGLPCAMDEILSIAKKHNLKIIEDCAQSFGAEYKDKKSGSLGDCGCFSFFPAKNLGCYGDGGMIATNEADLAEKLKILRNHGSKDKYFYVTRGFNSRLDTLQAAIVRVKLKHIDKWVNQRINCAKTYNELLKDIPNLSLLETPDYAKHAFNYYTVRIKKARNAIQGHLKQNGIASAVYYPLCLHLQQVYQELGYKKGDFANAEAAQEEVLSLPIYPELAQEQIQTVAQSLKSNFLRLQTA
jgi:dTDP-4-amino-4,6-dideoxygalactose transaminase